MATTSSTTVTEDCAVFFGHHGPLIASGDKIGLRTKIKAQLRSVQAWDCDTWIGLTLDFPLGKDQKANEEAGFGVRYRAPEHGSQDKSKLCDYHQIRIKFPRDFTHEVQLGQSPSTFTNEHLIYVKIHFGESRATIEGFGIPFANQEDHQVESWINGDAPIAGEYDILDIVQQQSLYLVLPAKSSLVKNLGTIQTLSAFRYPYSEGFSLDLTRYKKELRENKGQQFAPLYSQPTDVSHMTAVSQSIVHDVVWLRRAAKQLGYAYSKNRRGLDTSSKKPTRMPAYFFWCKAPDTDTDGKECLHLAIPFSEPLVKAIGPAWKLLIQRRIFKLRIYTSREGQECALVDWFCRLAPLGKLDRYARHRKDATDLILVVRRKIKMDDYSDVIWRGEPPREKLCHINLSRGPFFDKLKTFEDRQSASEARLLDEKSSNYISLGFHFEFNQCQHQVEAALLFHPQAHPYNPIACGLPTKLVSGVVKTDTLLDDMSEEQQQLFDEVKDRMDLHRSVLRGAGFYDWMTKTDGNSKRRPLPTIDLLDIDDETYANAILEMALPKDRARFRSYLSNRPLGIGIITGTPGSGKTALGATATLALQAKLGPILCSAPTDTAVDNFAYHLNKQTWDVTERLNAGKSLDDSNRYRRKLVVRLYSPNEEMNAFYILFTRPELGKEVLDSWKVPGEPNEDVNWKFHLSAAYWLLLLFESPAVDRRLGPDDSLALHELKKVIDEDRECGAIRYGHARHVSESLNDIFIELLDMLLEEADMLCTTPRPCGSNEFMPWQRRLARGVVVDQAGRMNRPDLYRVWGNTLLPCFLIGDTRSEQPIIQTTSEKEPGTENYYNRFAGDGQLSGLEFLQASGLPSFRLDTQVRMAKGMYDLAAQVFYPQLPLQYRQSDHEIADQQPDVGQELEAYVRMKYPNLRKPPGGIVHQPLFIHRQNSTIYKDVDGSQACQEQDSAVLSFVTGLVTHSAIDPAQIVILTPWFANAVLIERKRNQKRFELLKNMPEAATIESYRGRESDIVVVVMSTTRDTGPDITANEHLLITMLTRHKSGLVIFGDICTSGVVGEDRNGKLFKINKLGQELNALQRIDETLFDQGRIAVFSTKLGK
ncbi:DNA helicase [Fusarium pseudoanthophilum]|uniref:DNA helicase n=1 Tax=Fusarium pseudoanthophilum TaxID=48495 RepID=A0A8H5PQT3_9HYPO|nr:DNA helicase [Fusarium pseudoanthophilum]